MVRSRELLVMISRDLALFRQECSPWRSSEIPESMFQLFKLQLVGQSRKLLVSSYGDLG